MILGECTIRIRRHSNENTMEHATRVSAWNDQKHNSEMPTMGAAARWEGDAIRGIEQNHKKVDVSRA